MRTPEYAHTRTQDCKKSYFDAGQFYICSAKHWRLKFDFLNSGADAVELNYLEFIDLDEPEDLSLLRRIWNIN